MGANQANVMGNVRMYVGGNAGLPPVRDDGSTCIDNDNYTKEFPEPPWKSILKDTSQWHELLRASSALDTLTTKLITCAALNDNCAAWAPDTLLLAKMAVEALQAVPGFGEYNAAKALRTTIRWQLNRHGVRFPPGKQPYNWDHMSTTMPRKAKFLAEAGLDPNCPEAFVRAILHGGAGFPPDAHDALTALLDAWSDMDIGCMVCEVGAMCAIMCQRNALCNMEALLLFLQHIGTSNDPLCSQLRCEGVNAYALSVLTNKRPMHEVDDRLALISLRVGHHTKDANDRKEACDRMLNDLHPHRGGNSGGLGFVCLNPYPVKVVMLALFEAKLPRIMHNAYALQMNAAAHAAQCADNRQRSLEARALPKVPKKRPPNVTLTKAAALAQTRRLLLQERLLEDEKKRRSYLTNRSNALFRGHRIPAAKQLQPHPQRQSVGGIKTFLQELHWMCNTESKRSDRRVVVELVSDHFQDLVIQDLFILMPLILLGQLPTALIWDFLGMVSKCNFDGDSSADQALRVALTSGSDTKQGLQTYQRLLSARPVPAELELEATVQPALDISNPFRNGRWVPLPHNDAEGDEIAKLGEADENAEAVDAAAALEAAAMDDWTEGMGGSPIDATGSPLQEVCGTSDVRMAAIAADRRLVVIQLEERGGFVLIQRAHKAKIPAIEASVASQDASLADMAAEDGMTGSDGREFIRGARYEAYGAHGLVVFACYEAALEAFLLTHPDATCEAKRPWNVSGVQFDRSCGVCLMWMMLEESDDGSTLPCPVCARQTAIWDSLRNDDPPEESKNEKDPVRLAAGASRKMVRPRAFGRQRIRLTESSPVPPPAAGPAAAPAPAPAPPADPAVAQHHHQHLQQTYLRAAAVRHTQPASHARCDSPAGSTALQLACDAVPCQAKSADDFLVELHRNISHFPVLIREHVLGVLVKRMLEVVPCLEDPMTPKQIAVVNTGLLAVIKGVHDDKKQLTDMLNDKKVKRMLRQVPAHGLLPLQTQLQLPYHKLYGPKEWYNEVVPENFRYMQLYLIQLQGTAGDWTKLMRVLGKRKLVAIAKKEKHEETKKRKEVARAATDADHDADQRGPQLPSTTTKRKRGAESPLPERAFNVEEYNSKHPPLDQPQGLFKAVYLIDNFICYMHSMNSYKTAFECLHSRWCAWRTNESVAGQITDQYTKALVKSQFSRCVYPIAKSVPFSSPPLQEFNDDGGSLVIPNSIVYAKRCKSKSQYGAACSCYEDTGRRSTVSPGNQLVVQVLGDGHTYGAFVGLEKRVVTLEVFGNAKGPPRGAVRKLQSETLGDKHLMVWTAITRLGSGWGPVENGVTAFSGDGIQVASLHHPYMVKEVRCRIYNGRSMNWRDRDDDRRLLLAQVFGALEVSHKLDVRLLCKSPQCPGKMRRGLAVGICAVIERFYAQTLNVAVVRDSKLRSYMQRVFQSEQRWEQLVLALTRVEGLAGGELSREGALRVLAVLLRVYEGYDPVFPAWVDA